MTGTKLVFLIAVFACTVEEIVGCQCNKKPLHEAYCDADFVILAKISSPFKMQAVMNYLINFDIHVKKVFQQKVDLFKRDSVKTVFTPRTAAMCNAKLRKNTLYLLGGTIRRNAIFLTNCDLIVPWTQLQKHMRKALRKSKPSCQCTVTGCHRNFCIPLNEARTRTNKCKHASHQVRKCYEEHGVCSKKDGICGWSKSSAAKIYKCKKKKDEERRKKKTANTKNVFLDTASL